jgi:hypothetical protein
MIVQRTFPVLSNEERPRAALQAPKRVLARHEGRNRRYFASINSDTATQLLMYEIDDCRYFDSLHADPESQAVRRAALAHSQNRLGRGRGALSGGWMCDGDSEDRP